MRAFLILVLPCWAASRRHALSSGLSEELSHRSMCLLGGLRHELPRAADELRASAINGASRLVELFACLGRGKDVDLGGPVEV